MPQNSELSKKEVYDFLNELRLSGKTNMFGAAPFIAEEFAIEEDEAREWLSEWMKDF
jgi:hypothetical protein